MNVLHVDQHNILPLFARKKPFKRCIQPVEVSMSTHVAWATVAVVLLSAAAEGAVSLFVTSSEVSKTFLLKLLSFFSFSLLADLTVEDARTG